MRRRLVNYTALLLILSAARAEAQTCTTHADCADLDGNMIRDDGCVWSGCVNGECLSVDIHLGDVKGLGPECVPDGAVDGNDAGYGVLYCFSNIGYHDLEGFECEDSPPQAMHSDVGGRFGACAPDGVCDLHDRFHSLMAISNSSINGCTCPLDDPIGPAPPAPTGESQVRVFMAADGLQDAAPVTGNTTLVMNTGASATVVIWADVSAPVAGSAIGAYQLMVEDAAQLVSGQGTVTYVDVPWNPPDVSGNSIQIDTERTDWLFAGIPAAQFTGVWYTEPSLGYFGVLYGYFFGQSMEPAEGIHYLAAFKLQVSPDAYGKFELRFVREQAPDFPRPLSDFAQPFGHEYPVGEWQNLTILVGLATCAGPNTCGIGADLDLDGIRDDGCIWWGCEDGLCTPANIVFADMGGGDGACEPDGTADANDRFHALNCFSNQNIFGLQGYPCEPAPPAAFNVDAGGPFGGCAPDGVCDGNDAFHALNAFSGLTSCSCPAGGPAPVPDDAAPAGRRRAETATGVGRPGAK